MSPWTDLTQSGASYDFNYERDPLFGNTRDSLIYSKDYIQDEDPTNPYISPLYGNFSGFPPMLIQVGSYEMLLSDSELVAEKAKRAGCKVRLSVYEGMFHIFQMAMLMIPESKHAWQEIGRFLDIMELWYRDLLTAKSLREEGYLIQRDKKDAIFRAAKEPAALLAKKAAAVRTARMRLAQNANFRLTMEVMLMDLKETGK